MKNIYFILTLLFVNFCHAQEIEIKKVFGGYKYIQNGNDLTMRKLMNAVETNPEAYGLTKKAKNINTLTAVLGFAGGGLVGYPIGTALGGGDANWALAGVGAGLIAVAIPLSSSVNKKSKKAVELYNSGLNDASLYQFKPIISVINNQNGIGLVLSF